MTDEKEKKKKPLDRIDLRMHQVRALKELRLAKGVLNTEALMLILDKKYRTPEGGRMLFKYLDAQEEKEVMKRKVEVLEELSNSPYKDSPDLIIPTHSVNVDGVLTGFALPLIERHVNLGSYLNNSKNSFDKKKNLLKKMGDLLDRVSRIDAEHPMHFGDLNEFNFIIDRDGNLKAIDLDSSFVEREDLNPSNMAYYLLKNKYIASLPDKYKTTDTGIIIPSSNSDLYCYIMIILNTIANNPTMHRIDISTYYQYVKYLEEIGINDELIEVFRNIYIPKDNINPHTLIDLIEPGIEKKASFKSFEKKYNKN